MLLPERCSIKVQGKDCTIPPSHIVSIITENGEFMIGVTCEEHKEKMETSVKKMQQAGRISSGEINFQSIKLVTTDCIKPSKLDFDDYADRVKKST